MGRDINPVIFKHLKAFLGVFFKEVNFWPLILDISWVSGGMIALFQRKMLFFGSFVLFSVGKHFWCIWDAFRKSSENFGCISDAFRKFRSRDMNAAMWFVPSSVPFHSLLSLREIPYRRPVIRAIKRKMAGEEQELSAEQTEKLLQFQVIMATTSISKHQKWNNTTWIIVKIFHLWKNDTVVYKIEGHIFVVTAKFCPFVTCHVICHIDLDLVTLIQ